MNTLPGAPLQLTPMQSTDLEQVLAIDRTSFPSPWPRWYYQQQFDNPELARCEVLRCGPHIYGYSVGWLIADEFHLLTIATAPQTRRRGLGALLFLAALDGARQRQARELTLEVRPSNQAARQLYTRFGLKTLGRRPAYYADTGEDALIMSTPALNQVDYQNRLNHIWVNLYTRLQSQGLIPPQLEARPTPTLDQLKTQAPQQCPADN